MTPGKRDRLYVRANNQLVLDAGSCEETDSPRGSERLIRMPQTTLFRQVLAYLKSKPDPPVRLSGSQAGREGVAAAALTLRWGPISPYLWTATNQSGQKRGSRKQVGLVIEEMARINIEASAALAEWIDLFRSDGGGSFYMQLVNRAVYYLPMPRKTTKLKVTEFAALATEDLAERLIQATDTARLETVRTNTERHPTRIFANALVNTAWRNGPVESIHAGRFRGYPLDQRRITVMEERELIDFASQRLALGMAVCSELAMQQHHRPWHEQVLPYGLAEILMITPTSWVLTECSREVRLPA